MGSERNPAYLSFAHAFIYLPLTRIYHFWYWLLGLFITAIMWSRGERFVKLDTFPTLQPRWQQGQIFTEPRV